ncbi:unannotated protein [freshwater metagenome]|uniref:Unannotated protein n=1 Tax=freshwater metagenome TaxID=449393 RepID=A0A6J6GLQ4_9ZZZZ
MNDGVATGEYRTTGIVEAKSIATHVASDRSDATSGHFGETVFAEFGAQTIERVVFENLASHALFNRGTSACTHQQHDLAIGHRTEQSLKQVGAEETGGAGDEEPFAGECFTNHGECLPLGK